MQVTYHELETGFSGDSSSLVVADTEFSLEQLQPGRNYSISVAALSNNVESLPVPVYQATSEYTALLDTVDKHIYNYVLYQCTAMNGNQN